MRLLTSLAVIGALLCASGVSAQYTGPWTQEWDFNDGLQGWTKVAGPESGRWVDPEVDPNGPTIPKTPEAAPSGAGAGNLYVPDATLFQIAMPGGPATQFVLQADIFVPNMGGLAGDTYHPGNGIVHMGIGAVEADGRRIYASGRGDRNGGRIRDHSWDNVNRDRGFIMTTEALPYGERWNDWMTIQLVYNLDNSGKFTAHFYTPWERSWISPTGPGWVPIWGEWDIHPDGARQWEYLILGSVIPTVTSWSQAQIDNVKIYAVPEPASMLVLGTGLAGLMGLVRRRK